MDVLKIREDFPMLKVKDKHGNPIVYFDNAATTFKPQCVIDAVTDYYTKYCVNAGRGDYDLAYIVDTKISECRETVAKFINANKKEEIVFTKGASDSLNLVAKGYGITHLKKGDVVLSDEGEHASNYLPWVKACEATGAQLRHIPLTKDGKITIENFESMMDENVKVVAIAQVTNVLGNLADIKKICEIAHKYGAIVAVDGAQSTPHMKIDVQDLDCDFFSFASHKVCGPTGVGVLYGKYDLLEDTSPDQYGGGSNARFDMCGNILLRKAPYKFESGTPSIEGILGLNEAIKYVMSIGMDNIHAYEMELRDYLVEKMQKLDNVEVYNPNSDGAVVTFNVKGIFAQDVATYLSDNGISVRSGQHCAKLLLDFLGTSATCRASLYFYNTKEEIDKFVDVLKDATPENCLNVFF